MKALAAQSIGFMALALLAACASLPTGPSVAVIPGAGKSNEQFNSDNDECRQYAEYQTRAATRTGNGKSTQVAAGAAEETDGHVASESAAKYGPGNIQRVYDCLPKKK
jgi:hypothetical protein